MQNREAPHHLVDVLPESPLLRAERVLVALREAADSLDWRVRFGWEPAR